MMMQLHNSPPKLGGGPSEARRGGSHRRTLDASALGTTPALRATPPNLGGEFARILLLVVVVLSLPLLAAQRGQEPVARTAKTMAPVDLTGYWVSVVSEDWRHRMATPRKGDFESLPLTMEGRRAASAWDLDKDNAAGLQCKAFGIGGIIRQPGRIHITWEDNNTLKLDFDAGTQTRLLHFNKSAQAPPEKTWQGFSTAEWEGPALGRGGRGGGGEAQAETNSTLIEPGGGGRGLRGGPAPPNVVNQGGSLKVATTHFREGYLRKNGVPYSENASITEYFHRLPKHPNGDEWLLVVTAIDDPKYLNQIFYTSTQFKLETNGDKFNPTPCRTAPPPPLAK
jgi:hypothetical protein